MIEYTLTLMPDSPLEVALAPEEKNYVVTAGTYQMTATDGVNVVTWSSRIEFDPPAGKFIPFTDLKSTDMLGWIEATHADMIAKMKDHQAAELAEMVAPTRKALEYPWDTKARVAAEAAASIGE